MHSDVFGSADVLSCGLSCGAAACGWAGELMAAPSQSGSCNMLSCAGGCEQLRPLTESEGARHVGRAARGRR